MASRDVIDVKAVTRAQAVADAGQGAIQAVAEPVDGQGGDDAEEGAAIPTRRPVEQARGEHRHETEQRQVVGIDPGRHAVGQPDQRLLLDRRQHAELFALGILEGLCWHKINLHEGRAGVGGRVQTATFLRIPTRRLNFAVNGHTIRVKGTDNQMKLSFVAPILMIATLALCAQEAMPRMSSVDPSSAKVGDVVTVVGRTSTRRTSPRSISPTRRTISTCEVTSQTATEIKFKIPAKSTGRLALMILTDGKEQKLIEQPVKVTVE